MGRNARSATLLSLGALLAISSNTATTAIELEGGGLRRKRTTGAEYRSGGKTRLSDQREQPKIQPRTYRHIADEYDTSSAVTDKIDHTKKFFVPPTHEELDTIDLRQLMLELNDEMSIQFSPTFFPTYLGSLSTYSPTTFPDSGTFSPTIPDIGSDAPTSLNCALPGACENRLQEQIYSVSQRVGTVAALDDPTSPQSRARDWIVEECSADVPIDPCTESQIFLNEQRYALAVMYFSLGGDQWNEGANPTLNKGAGEGVWMSGLNFCDWNSQVSGANGIYSQLICDEFGNVMSLNLQSNNMAGQIPPEIGVLVYMTSYISFFNAQSGPIPTSLGLLKGLETFDVESNKMDGVLFQPEFVSAEGMSNIVNFRTSLNNFVGSIPTEIGEWTKLQNLWFADNKITGTIPSEIGNLVDMKALLLYDNEITGTLPTEIGNLKQLEWIDMENNQVSGTIPEVFFTNLELDEVIFKNNLFTGTIPEAVGDLSKLTAFWASFNILTGTIPTGFGGLTKLKELELQFNKFEGTIPVEFGNLESIDFLSVENNQLTGTIPSVLFGNNLGGLRILYMSSNKLTGVIPENFGQSPRLKDLWLNDNMLTGTLPSITVGEFSFLEELLIQNNDLTGVVDESICQVRNDTGGKLGNLQSDCQPTPGGGAPEIVCSCCTACFV